MNEADFRDWTRGQLRALDQRLKALAARQAEPAKLTADRRLQGDIATLADRLVARVKGGEVAGLAIAFVTEEGVPHTAFAGNGYFTLAGATAFLGLEVLEEFRKAEAANDQPSGDAGADQAPANG
jgi:hypothetical protein